MQDIQPPQPKPESDITLREQINIYLRHWPWFIVCVILTLSIAYIYLRYTTSEYKTVATILIKNEDKGGMAELATFQQMGLGGGFSPIDFENEMLLLKSKSLTERVVRELNLNVSYFIEGNIKTVEIYNERPFDVVIVKPSDSLSSNFKGNAALYITPISKDEFYYTEGEDGEQRKYNFGEILQLNNTSVVVTPNLNNILTNGEIKENTTKVNFSSDYSTVSYYRSAITVSQANKNSSIVEIGIVSPSKDKAEDVINALIKQYNLDAVEDKNLVSQNTADFIENRIVIISGELDTVESGKVRYKKENRLTDIEAESGIFLENASEFNKKQLEVETQLALVNTMIENLRQSSLTDLLPANLGFENNGVPQLIQNYNTIVLERNKLLRSATESNPLVVSLSSQLKDLRSNIAQSMQNARTALLINRKDLSGEEAQIGSKISEIPKKEKQIRSITRQQEIKEGLYLYLLQKREETAIALAVTTPKAKIVDYAYSLNDAVSPKRQIIISTAFFLGLLIPFLVLYIRQLLDNKIRNRTFVESKSNDIPVVGEIPLLAKTDEELVQKNDRSILSESFRILRTNLQYLFLNEINDNKRGKVILVTSTVKGEGKTFVATNLALTLANAGHKTLLIGGDIRNPQLQRYTTDKQRNREGVVEYLISDSDTIQPYLISSELNENLTFILSGVIPPNPAELWLRKRAANLFEEARDGYDYVIVDTAPAMLVTDTFLINQYANVILYVLRAGFTEKKLLDFPLDNIKNGKLKNVSFVINNVTAANFGYGNKYGYSYGDTNKPLWERIKGKFKG